MLQGKIHLFLRCGLLLGVLLSEPLRAACVRPLTVGWEPWRPFMYMADNAQLTGLDVQLIKAVVARMGCTLTFVQLPFKRHLLELRAGRIDLATSVQWTAEREQFAYFSKPYRDAQVRLLLRAGQAEHWPLARLEDLRPQAFRLGVTRGYFYGEQFARLSAEPGRVQIEDAISDEVNLKRLLAGRIDGLLADPLAVASLGPAAGQVEQHPLVLHASVFHFIGSRRALSQELMQQLDAALLQLQASGELQAIVARYQLH